MDSQNKRREVQKQQEQWMRERAAHSARLETQNVYSDSNSTEQIIDRVTSHLMVKIKQEIKEEMKQDKEGKTYERFLAAEIESHTCPICYELMLAPVNTPVLLHPCGHTFCKVCISRHRNNHSSRDKCPCCRENIAAQAPNISLQQLIQNYVLKKQSSEEKLSDLRIEDDITDGNQCRQNIDLDNSVSDDKIHHIRRDLQMKEMRARVMETELISLQDQKVKNKLQLNATQSRFDQASAKLQNIDEEIERLQEHRQKIKQSQQAVSVGLEQLFSERKELDERFVLISGVFSSLQEELNLLKVVMDEHISQAQQ